LFARSNPVFVDAEKGTEQLDVARFPQTETIGELFGQLRALQTEKHESDTVVLDSLDWIEPLIWKAVCDEGKVETIEQYAGGYGKGYIRALDLWRTLIKELAGLNHKMHVLLIAHAQIKSFQDPELASAYDRYQLKINERAVKIQLALALARVGDPEDMVYLSQLIEADIQRIRMGRT
jgi:AAA domain